MPAIDGTGRLRTRHPAPVGVGQRADGRRRQDSGGSRATCADPYPNAACLDCRRRSDSTSASGSIDALRDLHADGVDSGRGTRRRGRVRAAAVAGTATTCASTRGSVLISECPRHDVSTFARPAAPRSRCGTMASSHGDHHAPYRVATVGRKPWFRPSSTDDVGTISRHGVEHVAPVRPHGALVHAGERHPRVDVRRAAEALERSSATRSRPSSGSRGRRATRRCARRSASTACAIWRATSTLEHRRRSRARRAPRSR